MELYGKTAGGRKASPAGPGRDCGMNKLRRGVNRRLCILNQRSSTENLAKSSLILLVVCGLGMTYFMIALRLFRTLWYHKVFAAASAWMFGYSMYDLYFEHMEQKIKKSLPRNTKKLAHYYTHFRGNVIPAIREAEEKSTDESQLYLFKIRRALLSGDPKEETERLKKSFPFVWYRMLTSILYMAKEKGAEAEDNLFGKNLNKMTHILSFINIQQGYNDAELKYIQFFLYFMPILFIFSSDWVNARILIEMNMQHVYQGIDAQNLKAYLFLASNFSALFIHWMRKQQI
jgi:hypothetical protein